MVAIYVSVPPGEESFVQFSHYLVQPIIWTAATQTVDP